MRTQIVLVLDSSGSMQQIKDDTIGGFNEFVSEQEDEPGEARVTLYDFSSSVECVFEDYPPVEVPELDGDTYEPADKTALHDAIARAIKETRQRVGPKTDNVVVVALTDGRENASETPAETVRDRVAAAQDDGWEFLFIGAEEDAALQAEAIGVGAAHTLSWSDNSEGTKHAFHSASARVGETRAVGETDGFTDADRQRQEQAEEGDSGTSVKEFLEGNQSADEL